ncbi:MAG: extracellular solute-binding protein, partial [Euryarchaeota archaeon]|nr:extracellular solute-binding protein [Euryarchaeota archaeon]
MCGEQYGIPSIEVGPGLILAYNLDMFSEVGLSDTGPRTLEDVYQTHKKLTRMDPTGERLETVGIHPLDSMGTTYFETIWSAVFDVDWYDSVNRQLNMLAFEPTVDWLKRIYDTPGYSLISGAGIGGWTSGLLTGRLGMQINGYWVPGELKSLDCPWEFDYAWMPSALGDKATAALPWGMGVPYGAKNPDLSFQLIEMFATPEAAQEIFDAVGWLNGNLPAMKRLAIHDLPVVARIVAMFDEADRFFAP